MDYLASALGISSELLNIREELHMHPELGNHEYWTSNFIEDYLKSLGIETRRILDTAIIGRLRGNSSKKAVALRADMDALPVNEATGVSFTSINPGVMHACGHDIHMTAALGAARLLSQNRNALNGDVVFLFQPDEEGCGGAQRMISEGVLDGVSAVFGGHVEPGIPAGMIGFRYGMLFAASDLLTIKVHGRACHGSTPELGADALRAACDLVGRLSTMKVATNDRYVFSIGSMNAGTACNIIADYAELNGSFRALGKACLLKVREAIDEISAQVCKEYGVACEVIFHSSYSGAENTDAETTLLRDSAIQALGKERVYEVQEPTMGTEDFGFFVEETSGSFCQIGSGCDSPLHSSTFLPDGMAAVYAAAMYARTLENYLL